ncbi:hypothetical protein [Bacillus cereus]|uniref:hypothetical protein n=1 Tax=Bacillus cereus TaxID=1396 RepID=UPI000BF3103F|nr:hypothetical protein [Bacillus cereus]PEY30440.1 hypothetical protein CN347_28795 [Bacillus cereus]PFJ75961.1 hypothetical protein COJ08_15790 [Bacillus cereus]PFP21619.1 hypothetical protein COJ94_25920 [Bacillus cereus]PGM01766.1 hypothetical protein CN935_30455 [Bacillus cereus]
MRKFTRKSYAALITSLYSFSYFQTSQKYEQDHIASGNLALPYEPIWLLLYFLSPFFSMAITTWGILQNEEKKEKKEEEENLWLYRTSVIIVILTVFHHVTVIIN